MPDASDRSAPPPADAPPALPDAARWADVERLFHAAAEREPSERDAFLAASGEDGNLLAEVRALLAAEADAATFFERPNGLATLLGRLASGPEPGETDGAEGDGAHDGPLGPGARVGPWRLGDELGRGGMGVVYRAERADGLYAQTVALKVLKRGMDSDAVVQRFALERRVLAGLDHAGSDPAVAAIGRRIGLLPGAPGRAR